MSDILVHEISTQSQLRSKTLYEFIRTIYKSLPPFEIVDHYKEEDYRRWCYFDSSYKFKPKVKRSFEGDLMIFTSARGRFVKIKEKDGVILSVSMLFTGGSRNTAGKLLESLQKITDKKYIVRVYVIATNHSYRPEHFDVHVINEYKRAISLREEVKAS